MKSLNPAHLKALLGQEVSMTLSDGSTRQGTVYSLDPESFTIVLATPTSVRGGVGSNAWKNGEDHRGDPDACVVVPGHAVAAVEVVGGNLVDCCVWFSSIRSVPVNKKNIELTALYMRVARSQM